MRPTPAILRDIDDLLTGAPQDVMAYPDTAAIVPLGLITLGDGVTVLRIGMRSGVPFMAVDLGKFAGKEPPIRARMRRLDVQSHLARLTAEIQQAAALHIVATRNPSST